MYRIRLVVPRRELLGSQKKGADHKRLRRFIAEKAKSARAIVVSLNALMFGGLVQSREIVRPKLDVAGLKRAVKALLRMNPKLGIYSQFIVPRLMPLVRTEKDVGMWADTFEYSKERYKENKSGKGTRRLRDLKKRLPLRILRKIEANFRSVRRFAQGVASQASLFNCLLFSFEDCQRNGLNRILRDDLRKKLRQASNTFIADGGDEGGILLLSRSISHFRPNLKRGEASSLKLQTRDSRSGSPAKVAESERSRSVRVVGIKPEKLRMVPLYGMHTLKHNLDILGRLLDLEWEFRSPGPTDRGSSRQNRTGTESKGSLLIVNPPESPGRDLFLRPLDETSLTWPIRRGNLLQEAKVMPIPGIESTGHPFYLLDIRYTNGGDPSIINNLLRPEVTRYLRFYASTCTVSNSLGYAAAIITLDKALGNRASSEARNSTLIERLLDGLFFQGILRGRLKTILEREGINIYDLCSLTPVGQRAVVASIWQFLKEACSFIVKQGRFSRSIRRDFRLRVSLPWNRLFEAEIELKPKTTKSVRR